MRELSQSALAAVDDSTDTNAMKQVVDGEAFTRAFSSFRQLRFSAAAQPDPAAGASIDFHCSPQAIYHKNFELISESFTRFLSEGYRICILSNSEKQIERLKVIFADRGDDIAFSPVMPTVHEGFHDHSLKLCVFTDHQIFDRFHKYTLKSDRARSGKLALSLKN